MCNPIAALAIGGLGLIMKGVGAAQAASADNSAAEFNATIADQNADLADLQASQAKEQGEKDANQIKLRAKKLESQAMVDYASSGVVIGSGSPVDAIKSNAGEAEHDVVTTRYNAAQKARAYRIQQQSYLTTANMHRSSKRSPFLAAATTMIGGGGSLAGQFISQSS